MSEEYTEQESEEEETIEEDSSGDLTEAVEYDSWDEIVEEAIEDGVDIEDEEDFGDWLNETFEELAEEGDEDEEEDDEEEGDEEDVEGDDEEEVPEGAGAKARKAARLRYKKDKKDPAKMKRRAKLAKISAKKRKGKPVKKRKALKAGDDIEDSEIEEGEGAKARKAARLRYKKMSAGDKAKIAKRAKITAKKRKGKKVKHRKKLKASHVPTTKNQMLKNIYDQVNGMLKTDLASKYEQIMGATDLEEIEEEVAEPIRTKAVSPEDISPVNVEDDVNALMANEEGLSDEFKQKASTIFEAAVHAKVVDELNTKLEEIEGEKAQDSETFQKELTEKVDGYLTYVVEEWMKENELAIERGIRSELVEDFMSGLKTLFTEHYIDIPEEKVDMVDDLFTKVEDLETSLDEEINRGVELQKELAQFKKDDALQQSTKDLADTDSEKIAKLAEGIEFENTEQYIEKLNVLKESYFPKSDAVTSEITETDENIEVSEEQSPEKLDENMKHYTSAIRRYNS